MLRRLREFRVRYALVAERLAALAEIGVDHLLGDGKLRLRFVRTSEAREHLTADEVHALIVGREAHRRIDCRQRFTVLFLLHIDFGQTEERTRHFRVALQRFVEEALRFVIVSCALIKPRELLVGIGEVGLDSQILAEFRLGFFLVVKPHMRNSQAEVHERQIGICGCGALQFGQRFLRLLAVQVGLAENQMKFGLIPADLQKAAERFLVEFFFVGVGSRPDRVPGVSLSPTAAEKAAAADPVTGSFGPLLYNPAAFGAPTGLTFGNVGRDTLYLPSRLNFDFGLSKRFTFTERTGLDFKWETFNLFNHTQFGTCASGGGCSSPINTAFSVGSANFLHLVHAHDPRRMQFGLQLYF